jgi:hypothetical protein
LDAVYEASGKEWMAEVEDVDINLSVNGRVMEVLSESLPLCSGVPIGCRSPPKGVLFACRFTVTMAFGDMAVGLRARLLALSEPQPLAVFDGLGRGRTTKG